MLCFDLEIFKTFELKYILEWKYKCNIFILIRYFLSVFFFKSYFNELSFSVYSFLFISENFQTGRENNWEPLPQSF